MAGRQTEGSLGWNPLGSSRAAVRGARVDGVDEGERRTERHPCLEIC